MFFSLQQINHHSFSGSHAIKFKRNLVIAQNAAMQQKITVQNKRGEKLVGVLHETGSPKLVVLCHGFCSTKEYNMMVNLAAALENEGISAFRFDFSGNGESEGSFHFGNYSSEAEDLRSVVEYFTGLKRTTVAVIGHSKGGGVVLLYASKYHDIPAVVNISGRYDLKRGLEERLGKDFLEKLKKDGYIDIKNKSGEVDYRVTDESMTERLNTNMHKACLSIDKRCRVLIVHGSADEVIPVEDGHEFAKIIPNNRLQIVEGANHGYSSHQDELVATVLPFVKECVQQCEDVTN
ncbi:putative uncharacterized protein ydl057w [Phtheirospermum japonicum]|uniref:Serine aminopeptidase S33 domain-containing protein n=1 Tax=Phtheirospermum japonicum TaxID=374723 RepID=A0A830BYH0_9LAMI|nr:putative uncharacterized protein ydl057w [Phtheirospermum japonicum]